MQKTRRVTQADIAQALDLSPALVALVVGRSASRLRYCVKKSTAERIRAKATEMGYRPNRAAQVTRSGRSNLIIHLSRGGFSDVASQVSYHVSQLVHEAGFDLQTMDSYWWAGDGKEVIEQILAFQPEGLIVSGALGTPEADFGEIHRAGIPIVAPGLKLPGLPLVGYNAGEAIGKLTLHCLEGGRTPVLVLRAPSRRFWQILDREHGYRKVMAGVGHRKLIETDMSKETWKGRRPGIIADPGMGNLVHPFEDGMNVARWLLQGRDLPDALICSNDQYAIGIMTIFQREGIRIPEDVAITGFDNLDYATQGKVALTSVEQPIASFCQTGFDMLMEKIRPSSSSPHKKRHRMIHPCRIYWRDSTRFSPSAEDHAEVCHVTSRSTLSTSAHAVT